MDQAPKPAEAPKPKSRTMLLAVIIVVILVVVGVSVYILYRPTSPPGPTGPQVTIKDDGSCGPSDTSCYFSPSSINAAVNGAAVVWTNSGSIGHTITTCDTTNGASSTQCPSGTDATGLDSFNINIGASTTQSHVFTKAGTYYYYCAIHPNTMHGTVIVS